MKPTIESSGTQLLCAEVATTRPACHGIEARTHSAFAVGDLCVHCREEVEDLAHIMFRCSHWHKERRRQVELPADDVSVPRVKLHGLSPQTRLRRRCPLSYIMNLSWCTAQVFTLFGLMGPVVTAATPSTAVVVLDTTPTPRREHGSWDSRCTVLTF
eukprot:2787563-Amphidinium_carterae.1